MKTLKNYRIVSFIAVLIIGAAVGYAQNLSVNSTGLRPSVEIQLSGTVARDNEEISLAKVAKVNSGEVIKWTIYSSNKGKAAAKNQDAIAQIPNGTIYVVGSAKSDDPMTVTYSIDGGNNFSAQPLIAEKQSDGSIKKVPAPVSMYSQIRFHWEAPLEAAQVRKATYGVRVK